MNGKAIRGKTNIIGCHLKLPSQKRQILSYLGQYDIKGILVIFDMFY